MMFDIIFPIALVVIYVLWFSYKVFHTIEKEIPLTKWEVLQAGSKRCKENK